jgi:hypothetical protein
MRFEDLPAAGEQEDVVHSFYISPSGPPAATRRLHVCTSEAPDAVYRIAMPVTSRPSGYPYLAAVRSPIATIPTRRELW